MPETKVPNAAVPDLDPAVTRLRDDERNLLVTQRQVAVIRDGRTLAIGIVIDRECAEARPYSLPRLLRITAAAEPAFARELRDLYDFRACRGRRRELIAAGWRPAPVVVAFADGTRATCELFPPCLAETAPDEAEYLVEEVAASP